MRGIAGKLDWEKDHNSGAVVKRLIYYISERIRKF